jgi:hypothetical protein
VIDARVHRALVASIVAHGHAPDNEALAGALGVSRQEIDAALRRLADGHGLVLHPDRVAPWIVHPFSLSPTNVWVAGARDGWWAPCLWCALGIAALVPPPLTIHARIGGEAEPIAIEIDHTGFVVGGDLLVHFALPPRRAWDNVIHFCATVQPFRSSQERDHWCARHGIPVGALVTLPQLQALARRWYGSHLERDWHKWSTAEAQQIFASVGLDGDFWALDRHGRF